MILLKDRDVVQIKQALDYPTADRCFASMALLDRAPKFKPDEWIEVLVERARGCKNEC